MSTQADLLVIIYLHNFWSLLVSLTKPTSTFEYGKDAEKMIMRKDNLANYFLMNTIHDELERASIETDWTTTTCITDSLHAQFTHENKAKKVVFLEQKERVTTVTDVHSLCT